MPTPSHCRPLRTVCSAVALACASFASTAAELPLDVGRIVYVESGDPFLTALKDPRIVPNPPAIVILNIADGNANVAPFDADADALRARKTANGAPVRVLGYVYTDRARRATSDIKYSVNRYLNQRNGKVHFDGIFFDDTPNVCGTRSNPTKWRDKLYDLRNYVLNKLPSRNGVVANNAGSAIDACYLSSQRTTADLFVTFDDTLEAYTTDAASVDWEYGWEGGNVVQNGKFVSGSQWPNARFWHWIHQVPRKDIEATVQMAKSRAAHLVSASDSESDDAADYAVAYLNELIAAATGSAPTPTPTPTPEPTPEPTPTPTPTPTPAPGSWWKPSVGEVWQWQLSGTVSQSPAAAIYDIDGFENTKTTVDALHAKGRRVICYFSAGSFENWRPDAAQFPASVIGKAVDGWPGENWLDIRRIDLLAPIMRARMDMCKSKGFDAIEPDLMDGYSNATGFPLTAQDQLNYNRWLAQEAHARGLGVGLKNDPEQAKDLWADVDFVVTEECFQYNECQGFKTYFIDNGKPVFNTEYTLQKSAFCPQANTYGFSSLRKTLDLGAEWGTASDPYGPCK